MKPYKDFKTQPMTYGNEKLPAGAYIARIYDVEHVSTANGDHLLFSFDIEEGEYKGFFQRDWNTTPEEYRKWRGTHRMFLPRDDGSERDRWTKDRFERMIWSLEQSNNGFKWNWDEKALKGLYVGVLFRNKEWEWNGSSGWTTECSALCDVQAVRDGKARAPKDKPLANASTTTQAQSAGGFEDVPDSDLPF